MPGRGDTADRIRSGRTAPGCLPRARVTPGAGPGTHRRRKAGTQGAQDARTPQEGTSGSRRRQDATTRGERGRRGGRANSAPPAEVSALAGPHDAEQAERPSYPASCRTVLPAPGGRAPGAVGDPRTAGRAADRRAGGVGDPPCRRYGRTRPLRTAQRAHRSIRRPPLRSGGPCRPSRPRALRHRVREAAGLRPPGAGADGSRQSRAAGRHSRGGIPRARSVPNRTLLRAQPLAFS